jgi:predicted RNA binding protein YcfA (HicA-like mRNA interferase family)
MADYRRDLKKKLVEHNCEFVKPAKGSHELWQSPHSMRRFVVQKNLKSRIAANNILKQAGIFGEDF